MTHPGYSQLETVPPGMDTSYLQEREMELKVLTSSRIKDKLKELNIQPINYSFLK